MKKILLLAVAMVFATGAIFAQGLPTNPAPGKCYVKCITKDEFKQVEETVEVSPAYTVLKVVPAVYKTVTDKVLVKEASKKLIYVPAVYKTVDIPYIKKEKRTDLEIVPATFGSRIQTFEIYPKTSGWEYKQLEDCPSVDKDDCIAACFVEYPAQYRDVAITTLTKDAYATNVPVAEIPASYKQQVVDKPAYMKEVEIPAQYSSITRKVVETPARTVSETVAAKFQTVVRTVLAKKGGITTWEEVDCELLNPTILPIFYELASARLTPASKTVIDNTLLPILNSKNVRIEIMSHTDARGDDAYNMSLSQQRANSVVNYLVTKGISRNRLVAKGYGETRLVNRCSNGVQCSEADHRKNRRTEFRILGE